MPDRDFIDPDADDVWLARDPLPAEPVGLLDRWLRAAFAARAQLNPHAMTLATVDPDGRPSARIVLCKGIDPVAGTLRFFTNGASRKGAALRALPEAALVFHWGPQGRQARVEGTVARLDEAESDAYFASRPADAQLGAWASDQSRPIASRAALEARLRETAERFGVPFEAVAAGGVAPPGAVPRPPHWGGYRVEARSVELWRSRPARLHDRARWIRPRPDAPWSAQRLQP